MGFGCSGECELIFADLVRRMSEAGATPEAIAIAVEAVESVQAKDAERRAKQAERKRKSRDKTVTVTGQCCDTPLSPSMVSPIPPSLTTPIPPESRSTAKSDWPADFREQFWKLFPRKSGKQAAIRKLEVVRKGGQVPWERLIGAVRRYAEHVAGKDQQFTKHPSTWLNSGCWDDELPGMASAVPVPPVAVVGSTWVHSESQEWRALAERYRREKGHSPPLDRNLGWQFPDAWLSEIAA